jgi:uncharacterized protein
MHDRVVSLWRYPVKSMRGEALSAVPISLGGLLGDRAYAIVDALDGRVASAKDTRRWPSLFDFQAFSDPSDQADRGTPPVWIALPDGRRVASDDPDVEEVLSRALGRGARLQRRSAATALLLDLEAVGTQGFFDVATVHLLTTSTLERLRALYPSGSFDVRRFRPNVVIDTSSRQGFVEDSWVGKTLTIGAGVKLEVTEPCERCVMTTLAQPGLPYDPGILRTAATANELHVGVYARVLRGGVVACGQDVAFDHPEEGSA